MNRRQLQLESARAVVIINQTNGLSLAQFNSKFNQDSKEWYEMVIQWYVDEYGGLPSEVGPGTEIKMVHKDV